MKLSIHHAMFVALTLVALACDFRHPALPGQGFNPQPDPPGFNPQPDPPGAA